MPLENAKFNTLCSFLLQAFQIVVHGIPYKFTWRELKDFFNQKVGGAAHADIVCGRDGRSKVDGVISSFEKIGIGMGDGAF